MRLYKGVITDMQQSAVTIQLTTGHVINVLTNHMFTYGDIVEVLLHKGEIKCVYPQNSVDIDDLPEEPEEELFENES